MAEQYPVYFTSYFADKVEAADVTVTLNDTPPTDIASGDWRLVTPRNNAEIMKVTAVSGKVLTVVRAAEPVNGLQVALGHPAGEGCACGLTRDALAALIGAATGAVSSVFGRTGAVTAQTGDYTYTQVGADPAGAAAAALVTAEAYTDSTVANYVPITRTVNGHALSSNVVVTASDVGAPSGSGTSTGTNTGDQTITLTGDVTGSGTGSFGTTLATVNSNVGSFTYGSFTVDGKGRITAASSGAAPAVTSVFGRTGAVLAQAGDYTANDVGLGSVTNDAQTKAAVVPNTAPSAGQILVGNAGGTAYAPVSASGDAALASTGVLTLASVIVAGGPTGGAATVPVITYDAKGRLTAVTTAAITPAAIGAPSGSGTSTGTNTGDQTSVSGNAGTATALQTGRTLSITGDLAWTSPTFDGTANVTAAGTLATVNSNVGSFTYASLTVDGKGRITAAASGAAPASAANPTASVGLSAVNGSAATFMRSDGAPALDQSIAPTWSGTHTFQVNPTVSNAAPGMAFTDTTASAKSLTIAVDANLADLRESAASAGTMIQMDLANGVLGFISPASSTVGVSTAPATTSAAAFTGASTILVNQHTTNTAFLYLGQNFENRIDTASTANYTRSAGGGGIVGAQCLVRQQATVPGTVTKGSALTPGIVTDGTFTEFADLRCAVATITGSGAITTFSGVRIENLSPASGVTTAVGGSFASQLNATNVTNLLVGTNTAVSGSHNYYSAQGTITTAIPAAEYTVAWNESSTTFTAIDLNVTNTASAAASILQNWRKGGTSQFSVGITGLLLGTGFKNSRVTSDVTTTSNTQGNVTGLSFAIAASEVWTAEFHLTVTGSTAGMLFQVTGPASPTDLRITVVGNTSAVTAISAETITAFSTATATAYATGSITGFVRIVVSINNGSNAGTIQLQFAAQTNTQTNKVLANSYMVARRVA